jgi:hypothetical protein
VLPDLTPVTYNTSMHEERITLCAFCVT